MKLAGCINHAKTSSVSKDQGKFGLSSHDPFKVEKESSLRGRAS